MANCSIPNSTPATGRTSTRSSRRLKKGNNACASFREAFSRAKAIGSWALRSFNAQRSTPNAQRSIQRVGRWKLDVERWTFSSSGRVKGAWWPSRSSKPSSPRKWRGRFDSYPLRRVSSTLNARRSTLNAQFKQLGIGRWTLSIGRFLLRNWKGGEWNVT
jgi:hypothetical protein